LLIRYGLLTFALRHSLGHAAGESALCDACISSRYSLGCAYLYFIFAKAIQKFALYQPRPTFIPSLGLTIPIRSQFDVSWNSDFDSAAFHAGVEYITVRIKLIPRFFFHWQQHAKEPMHSGKLSSSRSSAPLVYFAMNMSAGSFKSPRRTQAQPLHLHSRPTRWCPNSTRCFNSIETSETTQASPSLIHDMYPQMVATARWSWGRGLAD
jgi:hypothetical protein